MRVKKAPKNTTGLSSVTDAMMKQLLLPDRRIRKVFSKKLIRQKMRCTTTIRLNLSGLVRKVNKVCKQRWCALQKLVHYQKNTICPCSPDFISLMFNCSFFPIQNMHKNINIGYFIFRMSCATKERAVWSLEVCLAELKGNFERNV